MKIYLKSDLAGVRRLLRKQSVAIQELVVGGTVRETGTTNFDVVKQTKVLALMLDARMIELMTSLVLVRFDAKIEVFFFRFAFIEPDASN